MDSISRWDQFRLGPQRKLEEAIIRLYQSKITESQRALLDEIEEKYSTLMRIAEGLVVEIVTAQEEMAGFK